MELKSVWKSNKSLPQKGRKIQFIITTNIVEVDKFVGEETRLAEKYWWQEVKLWKYLEE